MAVGRSHLLVVVLVALAQSAPSPGTDGDVATPAPSTVRTIMVTQSPAQAIEDAIRYDPDVAAALKSNDTQLYLLKSVTYTNGTAEDLGLPKEGLLPEGAPDRVRVADKIVYSSANNNNTTEEAAPLNQQSPAGVHATLQLLPVPIN